MEGWGLGPKSGICSVLSLVKTEAEVLEGSEECLIGGFGIAVTSDLVVLPLNIGCLFMAHSNSQYDTMVIDQPSRTKYLENYQHTTSYNMLDFKGLFFNNATDHVTWCVMGIVFSLYAFYVEKKKHNNPKYVAWCDIKDSVNCSRVLTSEYSRGFGFMSQIVGQKSVLNMPNCIMGIIFYLIQLITGLLPYLWTYHLLFYISIASCISSLYLAYVLFFVLREVCIVCMSTYVVNFVLLYLNYQRFLYAYNI
ncbi:hypothetical protein LSH36_184g12050 [Paralvinella palmiformis]|uniref:vitamin-K-epoxide reductase (warfarin-sensitive) n=1 Tax=Paralvinella palmiformis TaxID=53620 RepID=A0AAD9JSI0_9ANNE|nr:hypothetical protein LSH36_184g12050 [Paralvinella palmiformis]